MRATRRGFTLIEIIVAMSLTLVVFAITLPFVRTQTRALGSTAGRLDAEQIARFAQRAIDRELRLASSDPDQPMLVYAGPMGITFNANLLARDTLDPSALEVEVGADSAETEAWRLAAAAAIPLTSTTYPTVNYLDADGAASRIETISYFLHPDTISDRDDVYVLYRKVNALDSLQLVRGIHVPEDSAFFSYFRMVGGVLTALPSDSLPMFWTSPTLAEVRAVGLRSGGFFRNRQDNEDVIRTVYWRTVLTNATTATAATCGDAPGNPSSVAQSKQTGSSGFHVRVTWNASADDGSGDTDVTHYVVSTRLDVTPVQWVPIAVVPARAAATYRYEHYLPSLLGSVKYGVHAVDCGGTMSATIEHNSSLSLP
jgi:prepilin-type N-terminal cleavage/methylation domain-containing protein